MYAKRILVLATLLTLGSAETAQADFIYQFTTTTSAGPGGSLSFTITASDEAVATGTLYAFNITSLDLQVTCTSDPFFDVNTDDTRSLAGQGFQVNPTSGDYITDPCFIVFTGDFFAPSFATIETTTGGYTVSAFDPQGDLLGTAVGCGDLFFTETTSAVPKRSSLVWRAWEDSSP
jgi:hypothetical protein